MLEAEPAEDHPSHPFTLSSSFYPSLDANKLTAVAGAAVEKKRIGEAVLKFFSCATFWQMAVAVNKILKYSREKWALAEGALAEGKRTGRVKCSTSAQQL